MSYVYFLREAAQRQRRNASRIIAALLLALLFACLAVLWLCLDRYFLP